jgi:S-formylglutathione hydrolase
VSAATNRTASVSCVVLVVGFNLRYAAEQGMMIVAPDTSPRGDDVPDAEGYDIGKGAGFYLNATQAPWSAHYRMYDYIVDELPRLVEANFNTNGARSISGHSMGGHGALMIALRNPGRYRSVSAFSPIVAPSQVPWGEKAFSNYLGDNRESWLAYDSVALIENAQERLPLLVDQGSNDEFLSGQLKPHLLQNACNDAKHPFTLRMHDGHDHSYYFIASFIGEHIAYHSKHCR